MTIQRKIGLLPQKYLPPHSESEHLISEISRTLMFAKVSDEEERQDLSAQLTYLISQASALCTEMVILVDGAHVEEALPVEFWNANA